MIGFGGEQQKAGSVRGLGWGVGWGEPGLRAEQEKPRPLPCLPGIRCEGHDPVVDRHVTVLSWKGASTPCGTSPS